MLYLDLLPYEIQDMIYFELHKKNYDIVLNELISNTYDIRFQLEIEEMINSVIYDAIHSF